MLTWQDITEPGTLDDLIADACAAGHPQPSARMIHDWIARGLLDKPRLRTRHRGSDKAEHSADQRRLFLLLLDKRPQVTHLSDLAQVPLAVWLWWDGYVPTRQAERAWTTWVGRGRRSKDVARAGAAGLLEQIVHPLATATAKARFVRLVAGLQGDRVLTPRGRAELLDAVREVMEPDSVFAATGLARAIGPVQTPMTAQGVVGYAQAMNTALAGTLDGRVDGPLLEEARTTHRTSMTGYLTQRHELAAHAGTLAPLFQEPDVQEQFDQVGRHLLLTLGLLLTRRRPHRS